MVRTVYFDTSVFIELANKKSPIAKELKGLLKELIEKKVRIYTSIITVQEMSVALYRRELNRRIPMAIFIRWRGFTPLQKTLP
jgi:predicted nucleic acid-binding protein